MLENLIYKFSNLSENHFIYVHLLFGVKLLNMFEFFNILFKNELK